MVTIALANSAKVPKRSATHEAVRSMCTKLRESVPRFEECAFIDLKCIMKTSCTENVHSGRGSMALLRNALPQKNQLKGRLPSSLIAVDNCNVLGLRFFTVGGAAQEQSDHRVKIT